MNLPVIRRHKRVLVAYSAAGTHVQTTLDYLMSLSRYIDGEVHFVHMTHDAIMDFDFDSYDVVFHNYCARWPFDGHVSDSYAKALAHYTGVKILAVQDEYDRTNLLKKAIHDFRFDVVLTCIPPDQVERVYPGSEFPNVEFVTVLTGYVPENLGDLSKYALPLRERTTLLGYRGRDIGGRYGRLGFDKLEIGRRMREICEARGLPVNIDWTEESRIYGLNWFAFLGSCRATLGSESGSNVFDFDGSIERLYHEQADALGRKPTYQEFSPITDPKDAEMDIGQVSPRIFEAAALRTPMVLFEGRYSGVIRPGEHYIPLAKDFSNVDTVLARLEDFPALEAMVDRAHAHLVASGAFGYPAYMTMLNALMDRKLASVQRSAERLSTFFTASSKIWSEVETALIAERPTNQPAPQLYFEAKMARREALLQRGEVTRLVGEIKRLNEIYSNEILRLNDVYSNEIARLNDAYSNEIARLNKVYPEEIERLNSVYSSEISRLRHAHGGDSKLYADEIAKLNRQYSDELRSIRDKASHRAKFGADHIPETTRQARLTQLKRWVSDAPLTKPVVGWLRRALRG